jgi:hypothetical protein
MERNRNLSSIKIQDFSYRFDTNRALRSLHGFTGLDQVKKRLLLLENQVLGSLGGGQVVHAQGMEASFALLSFKRRFMSQPR